MLMVQLSAFHGPPVAHRWYTWIQYAVNVSFVRNKSAVATEKIWFKDSRQYIIKEKMLIKITKIHNYCTQYYTY
jgi:hypothetical protein